MDQQDEDIKNVDEEKGAIPNSQETIQSGHRTRKPTEKYAEWQSNLCEHEFKSKISAWRRCATKIHISLSDYKNVTVLKRERDILEDHMNAVTEAHERLAELSTEIYTDERHEQIEEQNLQLVKEIGGCIRQLENDVSSRHSDKSGGSHASKMSRFSQMSNSHAKLEATTDALLLRTKLKYIESEARQKVEYDTLRTKKELEMAEARLEAIMKLEVEGNWPQDLENGQHEFTQQYVQSLDTPVIESGTVLTNTSTHVASNPVPYASSPSQTADPHMAGLNTTAREFVPKPTTGQNHMQNTSRNPCEGTTPSHDTSTKQPTTGNMSSLNNDAVNEQLKDIARSFADQINLSRLPPPEPGIFTGDPLMFPSWKTAFETLIEHKGIPLVEQIYYLQKYLGGEAKATVEGYFLLASDGAFSEAKRLLDERYGHPFVIVNAFRHKMDSWPRIPVRDGKALRKFADFLRQCEAAMDAIGSLTVLNDERENQKMLHKLPEWLSLRWARLVCEWKERYRTFPAFTEFSRFISKEANIACDPVTSGIIEHANKPNRFGPKPRTISFHTEGSNLYNNQSKRKECTYCKNNHCINECKTFLACTMPERKVFIKEKRLCFACLWPGHMARSCRQRKSCNICHKQHPTPLHGDVKVNKETVQMTSSQEISSSNARVVHLSGTDHSSKCSMIIPVWLSHRDNTRPERLVYALLDTQSDTTFILDSTCWALGLDGPNVTLSLSTMLGKDKMVDSRKIQGLTVRGYGESESFPLPTAYSRNIMPCNRTHIPTPDVATKWPHLNKIADKLSSLQSCEVGLLIGYNCSRLLAPVDVITGVGNAPYAQKTVLGWGVVGIVDYDYAQDRSDDHIGVSHRIVACEVPLSQQLIKSIPRENSSPFRDQVFVSLRTSIKEVIAPRDVSRILELDFVEQNRCEMKVSQEDRKFLAIMNNGIRKLDDNHYEMPLPFRESDPRLPNNKSMAVSRLRQLKSRFEKNPKYRDDYITFMQNVIENGHAEKVPKSEIECENGKRWYIPHHGVYHPKKRDKIRVVFDCSANYNGESVNDHLLQGPDLTNKLVGVLCRFRCEPVAVMCDIQQMFHQFMVRGDHQDFLRFLWWENGDSNSEPVEYRMKVHLFGAVSSPGCANFGLKRTADDQEEECGSDAANFLRRNFYVDDGLTSTSCPTEAIKLICDSKNMCSNSGLRLHKFVSNSREVMKTIPVSERVEEVRDVSLCDKLPMGTALGLQWCIESDTFQFHITLKDSPLTRRGVLSTVNSIYDPLGLVAPVLLPGKRILQEMCREQMDWDTPLSDEMRMCWERWRRDLFGLENLNVPRCFKPKEFGTARSAELHHFSDASTYGYGVCSYLRLVDDEDRVHCSLVLGKARVAPLKPITIPRLELTAALVAVRVSVFLQQELEHENLRHIFWTDSKIVLGYIANDARRFHVFVANRIQQIKDHSEPSQWNHVKTDENPADIGSRGIGTGDLPKSKWLNGPDFLWSKSPVMKEKMPECIAPAPNDPELKKACVLSTQITQNFELDRLKSFSHWHHAKRALALCVKFKMHLKRLVQKSRSTESTKDTADSRPLYQTVNSDDLEHAEHHIIKQVQAEAFPDEIKVLQDLKDASSDGARDMPHESNKGVKISSALFHLDPYLDEDGLIRVGGRIRRANLTYGVKHPLILPKKHYITELVLRHFHERVQHQGRGITTNEIRGNGYWILGCSSAISSYINRCVKCRKLRGSVQSQKMADLPEDRLEPAPPFTYCGVDLFGPWLIKEGRKELKRYGVLFTCMSSRAIHIEVANALTTDAFINALRRFLAVRGNIKQLRCDQGTNFVGAERELREAIQEMNHTAIEKFLVKQGCDYMQIDFKMNSPAASHMGGVWERQIRTVRSILSSLLQSAGSQVDDDSLRTFMCEAMAIVNSRPLTTDNLNDITSLEPLTPNQLLTMKSHIVLPPPGQFMREDIYSRKRWRRVQHLANQFWFRWKREFLQNLQQRQKWNRPHRDIRVGDIVILKEENVPRNKWHLARVINTIVDKDDHVRRVRLEIGNGSIAATGKRTNPSTQLERPIHKLILLLPIEEQE